MGHHDATRQAGNARRQKKTTPTGKTHHGSNRNHCTLQQQKDGSAKNVSGYSASRGIDPDRVAAHRKITLGGLVKKHRLESLSPAVLLGALLDSVR